MRKNKGCLMFYACRILIAVIGAAAIILTAILTAFFMVGLLFAAFGVSYVHLGDYVLLLALVEWPIVLVVGCKNASKSLSLATDICDDWIEGKPKDRERVFKTARHCHVLVLLAVAETITFAVWGIIDQRINSMLIVYLFMALALFFVFWEYLFKLWAVKP